MARATEQPLDPALAGQAGRGGGNQHQACPARVQPELANPCGQRRGAGRMEGDLERFAKAGVEVRVGPAEQRRDEHEVTGARHRQNFGRPLEETECEGLTRGQGAGVAQTASGAGAGSSCVRRRRRTIA
ncbi:MAG: hypothetical protein NVS2B6_15390 [Thermoleophilaceae bacterium]